MDIRHLTKPLYSNSRALVIGIDKYQNAGPLSYAVSDAAAIRDILIDALEFSADDVVYLADSEATAQGIKRAFLRFCQDDVELDDRIIVFYAGHGYTRRGSRGDVGFLVPHDGDKADLSTLIPWDFFSSSAELIRAKHVLFVMDACYSGLAFKRSAHAGSTRLVKDMLRRYARQVLTAGKADEEVADSGGPIPEHSVFTGHLLEGLRGNAALDGEIITASSLMAYVYGRVGADNNSRQTPHWGHLEGDGDLILRAPLLADWAAEHAKDLDVLIEIPVPAAATDERTSEQKIAHIKELLSKDSTLIELHDFLCHEVQSFLAATSDDAFALDEEFSDDKFVERLSRYEDTALDLALLVSCVTHWGTDKHSPVL